jgi:tellurium resistance protein TerZ
MSTPIMLTKDMGAADLAGVTHLAVGLAWDTSTGGSGRIMGAIKQRVGVDLDALAILMQGPEPVVYVGLDNENPVDGAVTSTGDEHTGKAAGDDETLTVDFSKVPPEIDSILFTVSAFKKGTDFSKAKNVMVSVYDNTPGSPSTKVATIRPSLLGTGNMIVVAKATRGATQWSLEVVNEHKRFTQGDFRAMLRCVVGM